MKILVSNDDGFRAEGIRALARALSKDLAQVTVMAPDRNRSGASNSLTLDVPLRVQETEPDVYYVLGGTPTDCVHLAISGLFDHRHDMVVSGVNDGANLGDDVLYSGTVAAAIEGRFLGLPTIAVSLCTTRGSGRHFDTAARVARRLVAQLLEQPLERAADPQRQRSGPAVRAAARLSHDATGLAASLRAVIEARDPRNRPVYWIGPAGAGRTPGRAPTSMPLRRDYVSVTPLQIDLTRYSALDTVRGWLAKAGLND